MIKWLASVVALFLFMALNIPLEAKTLHVPAEYDNIQKAIDISDRGDTIKVAPGIYYENIRLRDGRSLIGAGANKTTITDNEQGPPDPIVEIDGDCLLQGFTITGARGAGIGHAVMITRGAPRILDNIVRDNSFTAIGIHSASSLTTPLVSRNRIYGNGGAGIANLGEFSKGIIRDNEIYNNTNAGIACTDLAAPLIENNLIYENGVGIATKDGAKSTAINNVISKNRLVGMPIIKKSSAVIKGNEIKDNGTVGINVDGESKVWLIKNNITDNGTEAVAIKGKSNAYIAFNSIMANIAITLQVRDSQATIVRNAIVSSDDPSKIITTDFLESQGIDLDHEHQISGTGVGVVDLKNSSVAVGGNTLGGKIEVDLASTVVKIKPSNLPRKINDIKLPDYQELAPDPEDNLTQPLTPPTIKKVRLPPVPKPKSFTSGCLGFF